MAQVNILATLVNGDARGADCLVGDGKGPEGVVAWLGGPAVMIRGGSRRAWFILCVGGRLGAYEVS